MLAVLIGSTGVSYALPECEGSPVDMPEHAYWSNGYAREYYTSDWNNCIGKVILKYGGVFTGKFENGKIANETERNNVNRQRSIGSKNADDQLVGIIDERQLMKQRIAEAKAFENKRERERQREKHEESQRQNRIDASKALENRREIQRQKRLAEVEAQKKLKRKIKSCMFENVEKVTNAMTKQIVLEECRDRAINGSDSDWSSKLINIIREIKKNYNDQ